MVRNFVRMRIKTLPWLALIFALLALVLLTLDGVGLLMVLVTAMFWLFSLVGIWWWASDSPQESDSASDARTDRATQEATARAAIEACAEASSLPLLIATRSSILAANAPARTALGAHIVGQDPRIALRHPDAVRLLEGKDAAESVTIRGLTRSGSLWTLTRTRAIDGIWVIEARDRTAEADISRAHTDFVANASHELRTPLSSIIGYVETLAESDDLEPALTKRFLGTVLREARRMQGLLADLMSLSQLEAEKHDVPTERIDLTALAARVVGEFAPPPGQTSRVEWDRPEDALTVVGDVKQLEQLLRNLIDNALKYGDADKPVTVHLAPAPRTMAELSVTDRGPGIAPDHLPHLTRRFYRTDPGRSRAAGGTGLGLAIVKHVVERHRGKLDISSTLGTGTKVCVRLPLVTAS